MKKCNQCNKIKEVKDFYKSKTHKDGYENKCKDCRNEQRRKHHKYKCKTCGEVFQSTRKAEFCSVACSSTNKAIPLREYLERISHRTDIKSVENYKNSYSPADFECANCGHVFSTTPNNVEFSGSGCPKCNGSMWLGDEIHDLLRDLTNGELILLGDYKNNRKPTTFKNVKCGHVFKTTYNSVARGARCVVCSKSSAEQEIHDWLVAEGIKFEMEVTFPDCRAVNGGLSRFDFCLDVKGEKVLLEYDGEHHFHKQAQRDNKRGLDYVMANDEIKNKYCEDNGIKLYRIPYTEKEHLKDLLHEIIRKETIPSEA